LARALAAPRAFSVADNMEVISTKSMSVTDDGGKLGAATAMPSTQGEGTG